MKPKKNSPKTQAMTLRLTNDLNDAIDFETQRQAVTKTDYISRALWDTLLDDRFGNPYTARTINALSQQTMQIFTQTIFENPIVVSSVLLCKSHGLSYEYLPEKLLLDAIVFSMTPLVHSHGLQFSEKFMASVAQEMLNDFDVKTMMIENEKHYRLFTDTGEFIPVVRGALLLTPIELIGSITVNIFSTCNEDVYMDNYGDCFNEERDDNAWNEICGDLIAYLEDGVEVERYKLEQSNTVANLFTNRLENYLNSNKLTQSDFEALADNPALLAQLLGDEVLADKLQITCQKHPMC